MWALPFQVFLGQCCHLQICAGVEMALPADCTLSRKKLQQRPPLRVADVLRLEQICAGTIKKPAIDRLMAGFAHFLWYICSSQALRC